MRESILRPLLFLTYVNDMPQAVKSNLVLMLVTHVLFFRERMLEKLKNS